MKTTTKTWKYAVQFIILTAALMLAASSANSANRIWTNAPVDGNWSTAANWSTGTAPVATDTFVFTNSSITSVTNDILAANANVNALTFAAGGDAFSLYGTGIAVNGNITNASANAQVINLDTLINNDRDIVGNTNVTLGGLTLNNGANRTLYNWLTNGTVTLNNVTLSEAAGTARTFSILGGASGAVAQANTTISGVVANGSTAASTLTYFGTGTLKYNGSAPSTHGNSSVTAGTLLLDFANMPTPENILNSASTLTLGGGTYSILGKSTGSTFQTNGNLTLTAGTGSGITLNNNGGSGTTLVLGNLGGRGGNSTLQIDTSAGGTLVVGTRPTEVNGIVSPAYATIKDGSGTGFATTNTGNTISRYAGATALANNSSDPTVNFAHTAAGSTFNWNNGITSRGVNSLAIDASANSGVLDLGGSGNLLTNSSRAILMTGNNNFTIQNGQLGFTNTEQIIHVIGNGALTVSATIGAGVGVVNTASLTKGGPGTLILSGANNYSNGTFVAEGTLKQGVANALGSNTRALSVAAGGVMDLNGLDLNVGLLQGNGGGIIVNNGGASATLTIGNGNPANAGTTTYTLMDGVNPLKLKMVGSQQLQISGASSWSGGTEITGGNPLGIRMNNSQALGTGPVTLNDGGIFVTSANPLPGGLGFVVPNNIIAVGNSANNALVVDANNGYVWAGNFTGAGTVKVNAGTRTGVNATFAGDLSLFNGTFNVAHGGASSTFQARMLQSGSASAKFALTTTGSQISFNGAGAATNVSLGELSGVASTRLSCDSAAKTFTIGALGTSSTFGGVIDNGNAVSSVVKVGAGVLTLGSAATYGGTTIVSNGLLFVSGLSSVNIVNVYAPGAFGGAGSVAGPVVLSAGNAGLLLTNSATATLTVGDGTIGLTLNDSNRLAFDVGTSPTSDSITVNGSFTQTGTNTVYISQAAGFGAGTFTLLTASSGGVNATNFTLGSTIPGYNLALSSDANNLYLTVSVSAPSAAFWHNRSGATWNTANNWDTDEFSGIALVSPPSNPTDITFASTFANNFNTTLGANLGIHNLDFKTASAVSVGGANTLTIGGSVTVESGAGNPSISTGGVALGVDQTWTVTDAAQTLSVSSPVSGGKQLTIAGAGTVALSGTNTYSGGTLITGTATLTLGGAGDTLANSGAVVIDGGTLNIGANNDIVGAISLTNGAIAGTSGVLTGAVYYAENGTISARLGGTASFIKGNVGTVLINGNNSYSGITTIGNGIVQLGSPTALGTGNATVVSGATLDLNGQTNNTVTSVTGAGFSAGAIINSSNAAAAIFAEIGNGQAFSVDATGDITLQRVRSGGGTFQLTKTGLGTLVLGTPAATSHNNLMALLVSQGKVVLNMPGFLAVDRDPVAVDTGAELWLAGSGGNQIQDDRTVTLNTGALFDVNGRSELFGYLVGAAGSVVTNSLSVSNSVLSVGGGQFNATGTCQHDGAIAGNINLTKGGTGIMTLTGDNTYIGNTTISVGTIALSGSGSISNSATINIVSGATLDASARTDSTFTLQANQTLMGNGTINGSLVTLPGSIVNPGASVGTLTVNNDIMLGGKLLLELNRTTTPNHDQLTNVSGTITYGGTLSVTNIGAALQVNDTFQLFPSAVTTFSGINLATTDATGNIYTWQNDVTVNGSIRVLTVTPPINVNPPQLQVSVAGNILSLGWPTNRGWILQSNSVGLTATSSWFNYPGDGSVTATNADITIDPIKTNVFFRMQKP